MIDRSTKLRWRRKFRRRQRQIEDIGYQTEENIDKLLFRRLGRLYEVRRFVLSWVVLVFALIFGLILQTRSLGSYYLTLGPADGGIFSEGIIGSYSNSNPIFASSDTDVTVSKLLYSGLLTYDKDSNLIGDLAESWSVDESGKIYTVVLKPDLHWHDGVEVTAEDVEFTIGLIKNPDSRSPYFSAWQGIKVEALNDREVQFTLPNILVSFPYSLTQGIVPKHKLSDIKTSDLRAHAFNTIEPVGTGPFEWKDVEVVGDTADQREQRIALTAYSDYHRGAPKLDEFILRTFLSEDSLLTSFRDGKLNAIAGSLSLPESGDDVNEIIVPMNGSVMVFLNNASPILSDAKIRNALTMATDQKDILHNVGVDTVATDGPLLSSHIGYNKDYAQHSLDVAKANASLDEAGWLLDPATGFRSKDGTRLSISLKTLNSPEFANVANRLQRQWLAVGVELRIDSLPQAELQLEVDARSYDALMYSVIMGSDADQFAYWHSSQADVRSQGGLNFANYKSEVADEALTAGRTRLDADVRSAKYLTFLQAWREDAPAIALYRPRFTYTVYGSLYNFNKDGFNSPINRLDNVHEWMIRNERVIQG